MPLIEILPGTLVNTDAIRWAFYHTPEPVLNVWAGHPEPQVFRGPDADRAWAAIRRGPVVIAGASPAMPGSLRELPTPDLIASMMRQAHDAEEIDQLGIGLLLCLLAAHLREAASRLMEGASQAQEAGPWQEGRGEDRS